MPKRKISLGTIPADSMKLVSKSFRTPAGCHIRHLERRKDGMEVSIACGDEGGSRMFPTPDGGQSTYRKALVKGVNEVRLPGGYIRGKDLRIDFVQTPSHVKCSKTVDHHALRCFVHTRDGSVLSGEKRGR
jgi:hypothetical protein